MIVISYHKRIIVIHLSLYNDSAILNAYSKCAQMRNATRPFAQWNPILAHLQHSKTLEKHENKDKLFELNV